jgi:hypothetical protein
MTENKLTSALLKLDADNEAIWSEEGLPSLEAVKELFGEDVTRNKIQMEWPNFSRQALIDYKESIVIEDEDSEAEVVAETPKVDEPEVPEVTEEPESETLEDINVEVSFESDVTTEAVKSEIYAIPENAHIGADAQVKILSQQFIYNQNTMAELNEQNVEISKRIEALAGREDRSNLSEHQKTVERQAFLKSEADQRVKRYEDNEKMKEVLGNKAPKNVSKLEQNIAAKNKKLRREQNLSTMT